MHTQLKTFNLKKKKKKKMYNSQKGKQAQITKYIKENYFKLNMKKKKKKTTS